MLSDINYHHLYYFWVVAREGGIQSAARKLRLAHPTISGQIKQLEAQLERRLFQRRGRRLELTKIGQIAFDYADIIFTTGHELLSALKHGDTERPTRVVVGLTEVMPKLVVRQFLEPAFAADPNIRLVLEEDSLESLLAQLAVHNIDVILADSTVPQGIHVRAFNHLLGDCGLVFLATRSLADSLNGEFPQNLDGAPMLVPTRGAVMRSSLERLFQECHVQPRIVAEVADSAMLKVLGADGYGVFAMPDLIEDEICSQYDVIPVGRSADYRERFYAISTERRIRHPSVVAVCSSARTELRGASQAE